MTFTIEDALISPMGLAILSGAGLASASVNDVKHVHCTIDAVVANGAAKITVNDLRDELGLANETSFYVCNSAAIPAFGTVLDASGAGIDYVEEVQLAGTAGTAYSDSIEVKDGQDLTLNVDTQFNNKTVKFDFYVFKDKGVQEIDIKPQDFGGYFYLEAQTLFRREDTGEDMAAEIIIPKAKVQSAMTISLSASGDPSTFTFTFDAFPAYTRFNKSKKVMCLIQVIGEDNTAASTEAEHKHTATTKTWANGDAVTAQADEPASPAANDYWFDTDVDTLYQYNGTAFVTATDVTVLDAEPDASGYSVGDKIYVKNAANIRVCQTA